MRYNRKNDCIEMSVVELCALANRRGDLNVRRPRRQWLPEQPTPDTDAPAAGPSPSQTVDDDALYCEAMEKVLAAIKSRNYVKASSCFTLEGLDVYNKLISYGTGRVVGQPDMVYYRSSNGQVVARGLQMSFSFMNGKRKNVCGRRGIHIQFGQENLQCGFRIRESGRVGYSEPLCTRMERRNPRIDHGVSGKLQDGLLFETSGLYP